MDIFKSFRKSPPFRRTPSSVTETVPLNPSLEEKLKALQESAGEQADLVVRKNVKGAVWALVYLETLVDAQALATSVIEPINKYLQTSHGFSESSDIKAVISAAKIVPVADLHHLVESLFSGQALILLDGCPEALAVFLPGFQRRAIEEPETENVMRGPREGFNEVLEDNLGILRRGIKDPNLRLEIKILGERTKNRAAILYLGNVANPDVVREVRKRLEQINIDGIIDSAYVKELIKDNRWTIYPLVESTERPDRVESAILEGRVAILVDKSPVVLVVPVTANEMYQTSEDYYFNFIVGSFIRTVRFIGTVISVGLPGLYIAAVSVNPGFMPVGFINIIAAGRTQVPVPVVFETFITLLLYEIFREAVIRIPKNINLILGISAGIIVGYIAVVSGFVAGSTLIIVIISALASFATASMEMEQGWRLARYFMLFLGGAFGLVGWVVAGTLIIGHMASLKSFGVSYLAPWSPPIAYDLLDTIVVPPLWTKYRRPPTYRPQEEDRLGVTEGEDKANA